MKYEDFIKDEKVNIQRFLSGLPESYRDEIQYDRTKNLKDAIWKEKYLYEQNKRRPHIRRIGRIWRITSKSRERKVCSLQSSETIIITNKDSQRKILQGKHHLRNVGYARKITFPFSAHIRKVTFTTFKRLQMLKM